jgi:hypothetical protein
LMSIPTGLMPVKRPISKSNVFSHHSTHIFI